MKPILVAILAVVCLVGCVPSDPCRCCPCCPCVDGQTCDACHANACNCCAVRPSERSPSDYLPSNAGAILDEASAFSQPDPAKLNEPKYGWNCPTCPNCPTVGPPIIVRPTPLPIVQPVPDVPVRLVAARPDPLNEMKTGAYACQCCRQAKVGVLFHTSWTDAGEPVTYLCAECWHRLNPTQRLEQFRNWIESQPNPVSMLKRDAMAGAVRSDS